MTLDVLQAEMIKAMKAGITGRKQVISNAIGAIKNAAIAEKCRDNIPEELVDKVLLKEMKTIKEMIDTCPEDREDLLEDYECQLAVIKEFAPQLITSKSEIRMTIYKLCEENNVELDKKNRGNLMKIVMPYFKGKADMKVVQSVLSELIS